MTRGAVAKRLGLSLSGVRELDDQLSPTRDGYGWRQYDQRRVELLRQERATQDAARSAARVRVASMRGDVPLERLRADGVRWTDIAAALGVTAQRAEARGPTALERDRAWKYSRRTRTRVQRCTGCGELGHNRRTCDETA